MTDEERLVAAGYDCVAERYAALEGDEPWPRLRWLEALLEQLPPHARVLDLGCGSGVPATRLLVDRGHAVVGVDVSTEQLTRARVNVPEAELIHASVVDLELEAGRLDAVVALYTLDHVPRERLAAVLASIQRWLRPGGLLLATFETLDEPGVVGTWLGVPMFFSSYPAETTLALARDAGLEVVRAEEQPQLEGSREVTYLWLLARRPAATSTSGL